MNPAGILVSGVCMIVSIPKGTENHNTTVKVVPQSQQIQTSIANQRGSPKLYKGVDKRTQTGRQRMPHKMAIPLANRYNT